MRPSPACQSISTLTGGQGRVEGAPRRAEAVGEAWPGPMDACLLSGSLPSVAVQRPKQLGVARESPQAWLSLLICSLQGGARGQKQHAPGRLLRGCLQHRSPGGAGGPQQGAGASGHRGRPSPSGALGACGPFPCLWAELPWTKPKHPGMGGRSLTPKAP